MPAILCGLFDCRREIRCTNEERNLPDDFDASAKISGWVDVFDPAFFQQVVTDRGRDLVRVVEQEFTALQQSLLNVLLHPWSALLQQLPGFQRAFQLRNTRDPQLLVNAQHALWVEAWEFAESRKLRRNFGAQRLEL